MVGVKQPAQARKTASLGCGMENILLERLTRANKARWVVGLLLIAGATFLQQVRRVPVPLAPVQAVGLFVLVYNSVLQVWLRGLRARPEQLLGRALAAVANTQVALDVVAFVAVMRLAGGVTSPMVLFLVLYMAGAGLLLSRPAAALQAAGAAALCALAELYPFGRFWALGPAASPSSAVGASALAALSALLPIFLVLLAVAYLTASAASERARQSRQLHALETRLAEEAEARLRLESELRAVQRKQVGYIRRVSHELKSPLASISTMLQVVLESLAGDVPEKQRDLIQRAEKRAAGALSLVEDLLTLSRMRELAVAEEVTEVDLEDLIASAIAEEELAAQRQGVVIVREVEGTLPLIRGHAEGLQAMLGNLISNAVKYSPHGGEVRVAARAEGDHVVIEVADNGIGIPEEDLPRVFDDFYRTPLSRQLGITGTGLGLPIVKSVVEHHGGEIAVESKVGSGTLFRVTLPIGGAPETASQDGPQQGSPEKPSLG